MHYPHTGILRAIYFTILGTHTVLAATVPFLAIITLRRGLEEPLCPAQKDRQMDTADLALCERNGRGGVFDAVQILSARSRLR